MDSNAEIRKVLIVDDEQEWLEKLSAVVIAHSRCQTVLLGSYEEADRYVTSDAMLGLAAAVIDVRLRKQIYDQGGLTILNLLKERDRRIPVLVLTAYSYDYPGLREITQRYPAVFAYDKDVFEKQPSAILDALLVELPPQIGEGSNSPRDVSSRTARRAVHDSERPRVLPEIASGALVITLVLGAALSFFLLGSEFTSFSWQLNIVFAVVMVALLAVLLRIFKPRIVTQAVSIYKELLGAHRGTSLADSTNTDTAETTRNLPQNAQQSGRGDADDRAPHP